MPRGPLICTPNCWPSPELNKISAADPALLSFYLAGSLPLDLDFKQKLLSLRSEADRLSILITYLETLIPNLHRAARAREKAGGNGHIH
jgi:Lon protease-like protein